MRLLPYFFQMVSKMKLPAAFSFYMLQILYCIGVCLCKFSIFIYYIFITFHHILPSPSPHIAFDHLKESLFRLQDLELVVIVSLVEFSLFIFIFQKNYRCLSRITLVAWSACVIVRRIAFGSSKLRLKEIEDTWRCQDDKKPTPQGVKKRN